MQDAIAFDILKIRIFLCFQTKIDSLNGLACRIPVPIRREINSLSRTLIQFCHLFLRFRGPVPVMSPGLNGTWNPELAARIPDSWFSLRTSPDDTPVPAVQNDPCLERPEVSFRS